MQIRTLSLAAVAATLTLSSCDEVGLPVNQTVDGATFEFTIPAGTTETTYDLVQSVAITQQLADAGVDNVTVEEITVEDVRIEIENGAVDAAETAQLLYLNHVKDLSVSINDTDVASRALKIASLAAVTGQDVTSAALQAVKDIDVASYLQGDRITGHTKIELREPITLEKPATVKITAKYNVKAKVGA